MKYKLICIDMFQTLVDITTRNEMIWKRILKDKYSEENRLFCSKLFNEKVILNFHSLTNNNEFKKLSEIFMPFYKEVSKETKLEFCEKNAVDIFIDEHNNSELYDDSLLFFQSLNKKIPICLVSDADELMIENLKTFFNFDKIFISEHSQSYKSSNNSKIFKDVLNEYNLSPKEILHIGDSLADISGANRIGIDSCWINRKNLDWKHKEKPTYIIESLTEILKIIKEKNNA